MQVTKSGYYKWIKRVHFEKPDILGVKVIRIFKSSFGIYGARHIHKALEAEGYKTTIFSVRQRMHKYNLIAKASKKYKS